LFEASATERKLAEDAKACRVRAEQGDAKAQYELAGMYYRGKGVPQDDIVAVGWCRKAANQGYARAQYALGYTYFEGKDVPQDYTETVRWYRKAADQGYAEAQSDLGYMYSQGKGVPQDCTAAVGWYRKAADQGYAKAQYALGYMYSHGEGVPQDYAQAARRCRKAAKQGDEYARRALDSMNIGFTAGSKITLSVAFLGSILLLISSRGNIRNRKQRRVMLAGLLGLSWLGLDVWGTPISAFFCHCRLSMLSTSARAFCAEYVLSCFFLLSSRRNARRAHSSYAASCSSGSISMPARITI